jgi:hypothetical protein
LTSTFEIKSWILSFGSSAQVLEPETLRQEVIQELQMAAENYTDTENETHQKPHTINEDRKRSKEVR